MIIGKNILKVEKFFQENPTTSIRQAAQILNNGWRRINYTIRILNITLLLSSRPGHLFKLKGGA